MTPRGLIRFLVVLLAAFWLYGLHSFIAMIGEIKEPRIDANLASTDAIVVLTGGSDRLATGVELLAAGKGRKLLVSGVPASLNVNQILARHAVSERLRECCIVLGHAADNTIGNAEETLAWMRAENYKTLRLVTAQYHMPRSLLIFHERLPADKIIPHPVLPESVRLDGWWKHPGTASLLVMEYNKYLFERLRVWAESLK